MLLAVGGGKCIDTAKLAADHLGNRYLPLLPLRLTVLLLPRSVLCTMRMVLSATSRLKEVPVHCFINPKLVLAAPVKYLWAGIGDAMAKHVESSWSAKAGRS